MDPLVADRLLGVFRRVFADDDLVVDDATVADDVPAWDSLNHVLLIGEVEKEFGIKLSLREILAMTSVGDLARTVALKIGG